MIVVMQKTRQVGIESDHLWCESGCNDLAVSLRGYPDVTPSTLPGMSELQYPVSNFAKPVQEWFLHSHGGLRIVRGVHSALRLRKSWEPLD